MNENNDVNLKGLKVIQRQAETKLFIGIQRQQPQKK